MELLDALRGTAAIREFTDEPVSDATVYRILDSARFAPSGGNKQGWRVVVVKDPEIRKGMRDLYQPGWRDYLALGEVLPAYAKFGSEWYKYPGSHWLEETGKIKGGIDFARFKETKAEYAFHLLFGHHGLFSLTPVMLLSLAGMLWGAARLMPALDLGLPGSRQGFQRLVGWPWRACRLHLLHHFLFIHLGWRRTECVFSSRTFCDGTRAISVSFHNRCISL